MASILHWFSLHNESLYGSSMWWGLDALMIPLQISSYEVLALGLSVLIYLTFWVEKIIFAWFAPII
jgi:hypothetical protein